MESYEDEQTTIGDVRIRLREVAAEDEAFLLEVYRTTRAEELAAWGWGEAQQELFLKMQLKARDRSYEMYYEGVEDRVILLNDLPAGRLIVSRTEEAIRLVDIALLPKYRGSGLGAFLIKDLIAEAARSNRPLRLQVEKTNARARRLYERLGFSVTGETETHIQMERTGATR